MSERGTQSNFSGTDSVKDFPERGNYHLRDIHNDSDEKISMRMIEALSKIEVKAKE